MSIQILTTQPSEKGTAILSVSPVDEDGNALVFSQLTNPQWQMMTKDGSVVPGCSFDDSALTALEWVIKGDQLAILGASDTGIRVITFTAAYSSTAGSDLPLNESCSFKVRDLLGID